MDRQQAIIFTIGVLIHRRIYAPLGLELTTYYDEIF